MVNGGIGMVCRGNRVWAGVGASFRCFFFCFCFCFYGFFFFFLCSILCLFFILFSFCWCLLVSFIAYFLFARCCVVCSCVGYLIRVIAVLFVFFVLRGHLHLACSLCSCFLFCVFLFAVYFREPRIPDAWLHQSCFWCFHAALCYS